METGSWPEAVGRYHSATPSRNSRYRARVLDFWNQGRGIVPRTQASAAPQAESPRGALGPGAPVAAPASPRFDADALGEIKNRLEELAPRP
jgi:hypothetical protein